MIVLIVAIFTVATIPTTAKQKTPNNGYPKDPPTWSQVNCRCTPEYNPVCDMFLRRFTNICYFECFNTFLAKYNFDTLDMYDCIKYEILTTTTLKPHKKI